MVKELSKKFRITQQDLAEEYDQFKYNMAFKKKRREVFISLKLLNLRDLKELD